MKVRSIGMLRRVDGGEQDDKVIAVPTHDVDPTWDAVERVDDLPAMERDRCQAVLRVHEQLPNGGKTIELDNFAPVEKAADVLETSLERYRDAH